MKSRIPVINRWFCWILSLIFCASFSRDAHSQSSSVVLWELYDTGQTNVPPGLTNVVEIAAGSGSFLALNGDGTVVAWDGGTTGQTYAVSGGSTFVAISAAGAAMALDSNGNIRGLGNPPLDFSQTFSTHVGLAANFNSEYFGVLSGMALQSDGTVSIAGDDTFDEADVPSSANSIVAIAVGNSFDLALRSDGTVIGWGDDTAGGTDVPAGLTNIVAISAEGDDGFSLQADGLVVGWGAHYYYGPGGAIPGVSNVVSISGDLALQSNGVAVPLGDAVELGVPSGFTNVVAVNGSSYWGMALIKTGKPVVMPVINESVYSGSSALLTSSAVGAYPLSYQWQRNGVNLPGASRRWLMLTNVQAANAGSYTVTVANASGAATSLAGQLTVSNAAPIIVAQPSDMVVPLGNTAAFTVTAIGSQPLSCQWEFDGNAIPGETNRSLLIPGITTVGQYSVLVTNAFGSILSSNASLTFAPSIVAGWGPATEITSIPPGLTNAVEIATGIYNHNSFAVALTANGTVTGWGDDQIGEIDIPAGLSNATQIAVGSDYCLALANGRVFAWGNNQFGNCNVPSDLTNAVAILAGQVPMALSADGKVVDWGENPDASVPSNVSNVIAIAEGDCELGLQCDGKVVAWGSSDFGLTNVPQDLSNVVAVAAGVSSCLALSANGKITAWGGLTNGQAGLTNVVEIAAQTSDQYDFYAAVTGSGSVVSWGQYFLGVTNFPYGELATNVPSSISNAASIFLQPYGGLTLNRDGTVSGWGNDGYERNIPPWLTNVAAISGPMVIEGHSPPRVLPMANEFVYSGDTAVLEANATGFPLNYQWQLNGVNISGANQPWLILTNVQTAAPLSNYTVIVSNAYGSATNIASINVVNSPPIILAQPQSLELPPNNNFTFSVNVIGSQPLTYQWQFNGTNIPGANGPSFTVTNAQLPDAGYYRVLVSNSYENPGGALISSNASLSFSITSVAVWGDNSAGELDIYSNLTDVLAVSAGYSHDLALLAGGTVVGWGDNEYGETQVPPNLTNAMAIAAGQEFSLALTANGTVIAWGYNALGATDVPPGLSNILAIAAGGNSAMALRNNGIVIVWGDPEVTNVPSSVSNVVSIAATSRNCLALRSDGTVVEWGDDSYGQTDFASSLTNIIALGSGSSSDCNTAVKADGTVVVWGFLQYSSMEPPAGLSNVVAVAAGPDFCLAMLANRTAFGWGPAGLDALKLPPGITNVTQISCGSESCIVLDPAGGVITLVPTQPFSGLSIGYLQATLNPLAAVSAGGGWGIVGQPYFSSNTNFTVAVSAGEPVALAFQPVDGWNVPNSHAVIVPMGGLTNINISYTVEPPVMSALPGTGFGLTGTTNTTYKIQYNTNLATGPWLTLFTNTLGQGFNKVAPWPPVTHASATYYRAVWLP